MKCKLCGNDMRCIIEQGHDYFMGVNGEEEFAIYYCDSCKIGYTYPDMDDETLGKYYPTTFEAYVCKHGVLNAMQVCKYRADIRVIQKMYGGGVSKVFEIGAGRGQFLSVLRRKWKNLTVIQGCEQSEHGVNSAKKEYNIDLEWKKAEDIVFEQKYDLIVMRHVLEHINNFDAVVENIKENGLKDGGILFLKLPKLNSYETKKFGKFSSGLDMPRHRVHFTDIGIKEFLLNSGFKNVKIFNEVVPSSFDRSMQYKKMGREYLSDKSKIFRYIWIELKLLMNKKQASRMIVVAKK